MTGATIGANLGVGNRTKTSYHQIAVHFTEANQKHPYTHVTLGGKVSLQFMAVRLVCSMILCLAYVLQLHVFYDMEGKT